MLTIRLLLSCF